MGANFGVSPVTEIDHSHPATDVKTSGAQQEDHHLKDREIWNWEMNSVSAVSNQNNIHKKQRVTLATA